MRHPTLVLPNVKSLAILKSGKLILINFHLYFSRNSVKIHTSFPTIFQLSRHHFKPIVAWLKFHVEKCAACSYQDDVDKDVEG